VLTAWAFGGGSLLGTLSGVGVVTGPVVSNPLPLWPVGVFKPVAVVTTASSASGISQLQSDWQTLTTELQTLATKSGVTVADIESVALDAQSISSAGFHFDASTLHNVISEIATAVAGGTSTSQAQSDWTAVFSGSSVTTTVINNTFNDLVKTVGDSHVTTTDLSTVASDEAAIQNDVANLGNQYWPAFGLTGISPLLATDSLQPIAVTLPNLPATSVATARAIVNTLPAVSLPFISSPTLPVISPTGIGLLTSLTHVGVVTGPVVNPRPLPLLVVNPTSKFQQLLTDEKALQSELQSLASKSGLTVAELQSLSQDAQMIALAGVHIPALALNTVISELAMAVAGGTSTSQALTDWTALFNGSLASTTLITGTFNDLVKAIGSSNVTTTDLTTVANDEAAIQTDLKNLWSVKVLSTGTGPSSGGTTGTKHPLPSHPVISHVSKPIVSHRASLIARHTKISEIRRKKG